VRVVALTAERRPNTLMTSGLACPPPIYGRQPAEVRRCQVEEEQPEHYWPVSPLSGLI
jgi:hypothetical protein